MYKFKANGIKPAPDLIAFPKRYFSSYNQYKMVGKCVILQNAYSSIISIVLITRIFFIGYFSFFCFQLPFIYVHTYIAPRVSLLKGVQREQKNIPNFPKT